MIPRGVPGVPCNRQITQTLLAVAIIFCTKVNFTAIISARKGVHVNTLQSESLFPSITTGNAPTHRESAIGLDGLDHLFRWASDAVPEGEDFRVRTARDKRIKREVLEVLQKAREQKVVARALDENSYLQRRVIALLQKITDVTHENSLLKQMTLAQYYSLQRLPSLESQIKELRTLQLEKDAAVTERRYLMDALAKLKIERDILDEMVIANEVENARLASMLSNSRTELAQLKAKRWWHAFLPSRKSA